MAEYNVENTRHMRQAEEIMFKIIEDKGDAGFSTNDVVERLRLAKFAPRLIRTMARSLILQFKGVGYIVKKKPLQYLVSDHNRSMVAVWCKNDGKAIPQGHPKDI